MDGMAGGLASAAVMIDLPVIQRPLPLGKLSNLHPAHRFEPVSYTHLIDGLSNSAANPYILQLGFIHIEGEHQNGSKGFKTLLSDFNFGLCLQFGNSGRWKCLIGQVIHFTSFQCQNSGAGIRDDAENQLVQICLLYTSRCV